MAEYKQDIGKLMGMVNIAEQFDEDQLTAIGEKVHKGYKADKESRKDWEKSIDDWTVLALQHREMKSYPWPKASNVKFPILSTAAMQFGARAYPALVPSDGKVVLIKVVGADPDGQKQLRADRVSKYMSYQLMEEMEDWEEEMDKMLVILPILGTCFKKTYWDSVKQRNCSKLILPKDLVVNYWAKSLEEAERKTEIIEMPKRVLKEKQLAGVYLDVDLSPPEVPQDRQKPGEKTGVSGQDQSDETTPYILLECHCYWDFDDDGYDEPYVITIEERSQKVLRIVPRYNKKSVIMKEGKIVKIDPIEYYTKFPFIPNPDGGFYDIGFGLLLGALNESVNTIINQLVDNGSLQVLSAGFLSKSLRLQLGSVKFQPGEWKQVNATGDTLKNSIVPLPINPPSDTLFKLLELVIQSSKELASIAEIFVGKMPGQNTPATTTMATVEQGMKLFTAIYKRIYRALGKEYYKLYQLNSEYLDPQTETAILDEPVGPQDFDIENYDICPKADPTAFSQQQRLLKAQALIEMAPLGTINVMEATKRVLEAMEQPQIEKLMLPQPAPDPEQQKLQMEAQIKQQESQQKMQIEQLKAQLDMQKMEMELKFKEMELQLKAKEAQMDIAVKSQEHQLDMKVTQEQAAMDMQVSKQEHEQALQQSEQEHSQAVQQSKTEHKQGMEQAKAQHSQKLQQTKEMAKAKPKPTKSSK